VKTKLIGLGLVVVLVMSFALPMCAPAPPAEEEELASTISCVQAWTPEYIEQVIAHIDEKLGVEYTQLYMSCGEIGAKLKAEAPYFTIDMVFGACGPQAYEAKKEGWAIQYDSPTWRGVGSEFKDTDNYWWSIADWVFVLVGNKDLLAQAGLSIDDLKSWDDLLDPKYKGQIVIPSPYTSGTAYLMMYTFMTIYGFNKGLTGSEAEEAGWEYLEALDKNIAFYTRSGAAPADLVGTGEFMLGMTYDQATYARIHEGYPIVWTMPEEGIGWDTSPCYILNTTTGKKLYTCQKIIDLFGTLEFSQISAAAGLQPKDPEALSAFFAEAGKVPNLVPNIDLDWTIENRDRLCEEWAERIGRVPTE